MVKHFRIWKNILKHSIPFTQYFSLNCCKARCKCDHEFDSVNDEILFLQDEISDLKSEAQDLLIRSCIEAGGAAGFILSEQFLMAAGGIYCASNDLLEACEKYNEAVKLEHYLNELETASNQNMDEEEDHSTKQWWQIWK